MTAADRREGLLRSTYDAFNARDIDAVLAGMAPDVDWPNGWEGGRVAGHDAVRAYWERQWSEIAPSVDPVSFSPRAGDRLAVEVAQTVRSLDGTILARETVHHVYTFSADDLVVRMDIEP